MSQFYTDESRESETYALPDAEVFYHDGSVETDNHGDPYCDPLEAGWYYWFCFPGCLPDSDPYGPFATEEEAIADARENS